ncbi:MAG: thermonuclease family protein [Pseudomonadota bacterium]
MRHILLGLLVLGLAACGRAGGSAETAEADTVNTASALSAPERADSFSVLDGEEPVEVRLVEIEAVRGGADGAAARARLEALLAEAGPGLRLVSTGLERDRYGRRLAHGEFDRGEETVWLQGVLVSEGHAMVASYADNHARTEALLQLEADARANNRGGWASGALTVRGPDPNPLAQHLDSRQIVEGRVVDVSPEIRGRIYLNFGLDWRTDFTVAIEADALDAFTAAGKAPDGLEGAIVRVRGWLSEENGPMIRIDHQAALEIVSAPEPAALPGR